MPSLVPMGLVILFAAGRAIMLKNPMIILEGSSRRRLFLMICLRSPTPPRVANISSFAAAYLFHKSEVKRGWGGGRKGEKRRSSP